jgi:phage shock protein PspC (stress-responsive transcriptional regulator)
MSRPPLTRSTDDRVIAGVAGGVARHLGLDPTLVRVVWAISLLFGGLGLIVYVILWIALPKGEPASQAVRIAEERYARGEISGSELERIRADLERAR